MPPGTGRWCATTRRCGRAEATRSSWTRPRPRIPLADYIYNELRYKILRNRDPVEAERLLVLAQEAVDQRWQTYEEMATRGAQRFPTDARVRGADTGVPAGSGRAAFAAEPQDVGPVQRLTRRKGRRSDHLGHLRREHGRRFHGAARQARRCR